MASQSDIQKLAKISRITINNDEIATIAHNINEALGYIEIINQADDVNMIYEIIPQHNLTNIMRDDISQQSNFQDAIFKQGPSVEERLFVIPSLIERS
jgi:aspartyl-tRNA(Asn)/glutamyl-tRNA(Gln) amidotransferase subunit C